MVVVLLTPPLLLNNAIDFKRSEGLGKREQFAHLLYAKLAPIVRWRTLSSPALDQIVGILCEVTDSSLTAEGSISPDVTTDGLAPSDADVKTRGSTPGTAARGIM